jgi:deazaflavin-dependent oxidoreductase (nitroreductase family)
MSTEQPSGRRPPPQMPSDMLAFNRQVIQDFRANKGELSGPMAGRKLMLLTTKGAKSGQERTVVLGFGKEAQRYVIVASANGAPKHPTWYRNLEANPEVTVEVGAEKFKAHARTASKEERDRLKGLIPFYEGEQKKTSREIPLVILEPRK